MYISLVAVLLLAFSVCACKKGSKEQTSSLTLSENLAAEDSQDPENTELGGESGAEVEIKEPIVKEGKANGIDVSKWQGKIDWKAVKAAGIDFAVIRIGFRGENGEIYKDSYADFNIQQAQKAGVLVGVYFFSTAANRNEAEEEAKWVVNAIEGYSVSYPVVYDCEGFLNSESRMYGLTNKDRTDNAISFLKIISDNGYEGMLYSAKTELEGSKYWETDRLESVCKIWVARYPDKPYPDTAHPDYTGKYDMWQYTDNSRINGISGNVDMSVSYFTREKASPKNAKAHTEDAAAPAEKDNVYTAASDEVTAKIEVNLRRSASVKAEIAGVLKNGEFLKRTGIGSNGWSCLEYNGTKVYVITSYLTADRNYSAPVTENDGFSPADGQLTAKDETNLRAEPSTSAELVATIKNGEFLTRTGENPNGWTRLLYNGRVVYAKTNLLTDKVKEPAASSSTLPEDVFTPADGKFTAKEKTNLRTAPSTNGPEVVYTLAFGEFAERTGYNTQSGWTRLVYSGQTVYAVTSFLISEADYNVLLQSQNAEN